MKAKTHLKSYETKSEILLGQYLIPEMIMIKVYEDQI